MLFNIICICVNFKKIIWSFRVLEFMLEKEHKVVEKKRYDVR